MLWTFLILILLCAIGVLLWMHHQREQAWKHELSRLENGEALEKSSSEFAKDEEEETALHHLSDEAKIAYSKTIAKLRLLAAQYAQKNGGLKTGSKEDSAPDYVDDGSVYSEQLLDNEEVQNIHPDSSNHSSLGHGYVKPLAMNIDNELAKKNELSSSSVSVMKNRHKTVPYISPFLETETPEYVSAKVVDSDLPVISLEEATRSLHEATLLEFSEKKNNQARKTSINLETPHTTKNLQTIDSNDPILRRTRERVIASVQEIAQNMPASKLMTVNRASGFLTDEVVLKEETTIKAVAESTKHWDEINVDEIRENLLRHTNARQHLMGGKNPPRKPKPQIIQNDEILVNLAQTSSPLSRRARPIRRIDTSMKESVLPDAVRIEQSSVKVQPKKSLFPPKIARFSTESTIAKIAAPSATVVEPPTVPQVEPIAIDIPEPPVFNEPPVAVLPEVVVNAHVSNKPLRSINDYLISESVDNGVEVKDSLSEFETNISFQTASVAEDAFLSDEQDKLTADVFEHKHIVDGSEWHHSEQNNNDAFALLNEAFALDDEMLEIDEEADIDSSNYEFYESTISDKHLPSTDLLLPPQFDPSAKQTEEALIENGIIIEEKLAEFKVKVKVVDSYSGPVITRYEIEPDVGVRGSAVINLEKDLARSLGVASIRVVETIPGKTCMGLELPNPRRQMIRLSEIFNSAAFTESKSKLTLVLGQDITGEPVVTDLAKAPHLLVAGTTGSGKSVGVNAMILSMLFKATPEEVRMIMIDPKMLELSIYEGIPHLLAPVVTDMKLAANALNWCVNEMEKRYRLLSHVGVRNLAGFNQKIAEATIKGEKLTNPFSLTPDNPEPLEKLPFIVVVVDEFADLMMTAGKKIEELIARLAQKARAAGIHLILATQRPSVDVITGLIKANIPTRVAFQVSSKIDSRTILDQMGAENLLGQGDMLFLPPGTGYPQRVHGAFASDDEVHNVVEYLKQFGEPDYIDEILSSGSSDDLPGMTRGNDVEIDPMYDEAVAVVLKTRKASISGVQRALRIGYNRAARLIDQMEAEGIVSAAESNGNRTILAPNSQHLD